MDWSDYVAGELIAERLAARRAEAARARLARVRSSRPRWRTAVGLALVRLGSYLAGGVGAMTSARSRARGTAPS